jgi:hypothetical protein
MNYMLFFESRLCGQISICLNWIESVILGGSYYNNAVRFCRTSCEGAVDRLKSHDLRN